MASPESQYEPSALSRWFGSSWKDGVPLDLRDGPRVSRVMDQVWNRPGPFQCVVAVGKLRYNFLIEYSEDQTSMEHVGLQIIYNGLETEDDELVFRGVDQCMKMIWSFLRYQLDRGLIRHEGGEVDRLSDDGSCIMVLLKSENGKHIEKEHHLEVTLYPEPIENPDPSLPLFPEHTVEVLERLSMRVFKVKVNDINYCAKLERLSGPSSLGPEIEKLKKVGNNANVVHPAGLIDAGGGMVVGMLLPFIPGPTIETVQYVTELLKAKWKEQLTEVIQFLHSVNVVWGDVKPQNVIIEKNHKNIVLIDFEGGITIGWVDEEVGDTKEGDLVGLRKLLKYIDEKPVSEEISDHPLELCVNPRKS